MSKQKQPSAYEQHRANVNRIIAELERELARLNNKGGQMTCSTRAPAL